MKGYKIYISDSYHNCEVDVVYTTDYDLAIAKWNKLLIKAMENRELVTDKREFGEIKSEYKEPSISEKMGYEEEKDILLMKAPYVIYKKGGCLIGKVFYITCDYEGYEYDTADIDVIIEEIKILGADNNVGYSRKRASKQAKEAN